MSSFYLCDLLVSCCFVVAIEIRVGLLRLCACVSVSVAPAQKVHAEHNSIHRDLKARPISRSSCAMLLNVVLFKFLFP